MQILAAVLLVLGALFMALGALGLVRYPDVYLRMQATSKASTLGVTLMMAGVACQAGSLGIALEALLIIVFFFLTSPVAAYMIARAAYYKGTPLWEGTHLDELRPRREAARRPQTAEPGGDCPQR